MISAGGATVPAGVGGHGSSSAWVRAEQVARTSYGRLLALLASRSGDIELAEDCLSDAFARALEHWPVDGVPGNPEAWLLTAARNRQRDVFKSAAARSSVPLEREEASLLAPAFEDLDPDAIPEHRLALLFVCAHPAIDPDIRAPLMLQAVLGFEAQQIARAFAVPSSTMAQRLVRAKRRIKAAHIPFVLPERARMPARLGAVLEAIYGTYAIDREGIAGPSTRDSMAAEAHYLAVTLAELLEEEPEAFGLAAMICLSWARVPASGSGSEFVPLESQDSLLWDAELIREGERYLRRARSLGRIGRFQLEAAIQSAHCARAATGTTDWKALRRLYAGLVAIAPTLGARVAQAAAVARVEGVESGLATLDAIHDSRIEHFQPAWATRGHLLALAGRHAQAVQAYAKAISLTVDPAARAFLQARRDEISNSALPGTTTRRGDGR